MSIMVEKQREQSRKMAIRYYSRLAINGFYFEEGDWRRLDKVGWGGVFAAFPEYQSHVNWSKIFADNWLCFVQANAGYIQADQRQPKTSADWRILLTEHPQYAANCDWTTLDVADRKALIARHPQLAPFGEEDLSWKCLIDKNGYAKIPEGTGRIEEEAFDGCVNLKRIDLPVSLAWIKRAAFRGCTGLERIDFPINLMRIDEEAFAGCENLREVILPEGIENLKDNVFPKTCKKLLWNASKKEEICFK